MINSMQKAIIKKDLRFVLTNKGLLTSLIVVPLVFTVIFPAMFILIFHFVPEDLGDFQELLNMMPSSQVSESLSRAVMAMIMDFVMPTFFIIVPVIAASTMAAGSFVGEKEKRTLETLLYCPLPLKKIFESKVLASFFLSMVVTLISFVVMQIVVQTLVFLTTGSMLAPGLAWIFIILVVSPAVSLLAITMIVGGSAKAKTMEESFQRSAFMILPMVFMATAQLSGIVLINAWFLLAFGIIVAIIAAVLLKRSMRKYTYEALLR